MPAARAPNRRLVDALFTPRAVALIGVSNDAAKTSARPLLFLRKHGFPGKVYAINPRRDTVLGERAYRSLAELPEPVEHAYILVNTPAVEVELAACAEAGVRVATILAGGFGEAGSEGAARQERLRGISARTGLRLLGPNSIGVVNTHFPMALTANAVFAADPLSKGRLTLISQSGGALGTLVSRGAPRGIGFAKLVSVGNETDLSVGEIGAALVEDAETDAFLLFLETIRQPAHMAQFAALAAKAGKPIIAYKLGRSEVGRELAISHTGAMVGSDAAADAFFRRHGILRVGHLETLLELPPLIIGRKPRPRGRATSVGVVATTGGGAAMVVDRLGMLGIDVAAPRAGTRARLKAAGITVPPGRLLDLTLAGTRYEIMRAALDTLIAAPEFAVIAAVVGSSAQSHPELAIKPLLDGARGEKPLAVFVAPQAEAALRLLALNGIAAFRTPEACADGIAAYLAWRGARAEIAPRLLTASLAPSALLPGDPAGRVLDEARSLALFDRLGIPVAKFSVIGLGGAAPRHLRFGFPVVAKVLSADITHKTDVGAVALDIGSPEELARKIGALLKAVRRRRPAARIAGILVQKMERGIAEVLLGFRRDPQVGPVVTIGVGGTLAEIYRDFSVRLAPIGREEANEMVAELRGLAMIRGYRGLPRGDVGALARAILSFSQLAHLFDAAILEAEINPLIIKPDGKGVVAVDGVVRRR